MSDGGWYGYPPQEPDPYGQQPQDDWNRPPLDYGNAAQAPGYDQYGQGADPQAYYEQQPQPQQPPQPRRQPPGRARGPQPGQYPDPQAASSQNPYLQQPGQGREGPQQSGRDAGGGRRGRPAQGYEQQSGYDASGGYPQGYDSAAGYEQPGYGSGSYDTASRGPARPAAGGGSRRRAAPAGGPGGGYADQQPRDPYQDLGAPAEGAEDGYEYPAPGRGGRGAGPRPRTAEQGTGTQPRIGERGTAAQPKVDDDARFPLPGREADEGGRPTDQDGEDGGGKKGRGGKNKKKARRGCLATFVVFAILAGLVTFKGYQYYESHYGPPADYGSSTGTAQTVVVTIPDSATGDEIAQILLDKGVIKSERAFTKACDANSKCSSVQANTYQLHEQMSAAGALTALLDPGNVYNKAQLLVRPGERAADVFADLEQKTGWTQAQILSAVNGGQIDLPSYAKAKAGTNFPFANIEGMLFTGTYQLPGYKTPAQLLKAMVDKQLAMFQAVGLTQKASSVGLTPYQALIVASMARAEAGSDAADLNKIAGVIYNRFKDTQQFAHLGFDTTTLYGMGNTTTTPDNLDSSNPYNTSIHGITGLPPGPIDSVDQTALTGVLAPDDRTDLYFCAANGTVLYAATDSAWKQLGKEHPGLCGD